MFISFENVEYKYNETVILDNFNLQINKGEKIALVGSSGEGKTTIIRLLLKFLTPQKGRILIENNDLKDIPDEEWYRRIGVLSQNAHIFNRTLRENLLIAKPSATDKELLEALERSGLKKFLEKRNGLETQLGSKGVAISGGERTRIALTRLLLKDPEFLILDEPLEGVDKLVEKEVIENIRNFIKDKTLLLISHRFSILSLTEEFAVLQDGKIVEKDKFHNFSENSLLKKFFKAENELTEKFRRGKENGNADKMDYEVQ
ncbi:ABC transporter [Marinitoga sp. 1135]|uniref:ATP-binding cassette domain-containing protein n=1 Tax=Marinitoga sp. 1135 TaxID=1643333 RepID=UPI0015860E28|nr:ATP-binding cassette domain-containing protein [Marinitoga sp. 1135]NUU95487.1 ABC transporter [Marinitoga sp. 1135]